jgi:hypothetical protein
MVGIEIQEGRIMGKDSPTPPDPSQTAAAQGEWNSFTAQQQQAMNMVGQNTPYGSLAYNQTGSSTMTDPSGKQISVPQYTATQTLSPSQQAIFDQTQSAQGNLAGLANDQSAKLKDYLGTSFDYNPGNDATKWAYDLGSKTILPQQQRDTEALQRQLLQRGLRPGTDQYNDAIRQQSQNQGSQLDQLALQGEGQAFNEAAYKRSSPINEITSLLSGSQITQPNSTFASTPQTSVGGVDYSGLVNNNYNQQVAQNNAAMGGMFGIGGTLAAGAMKYGLPLLAASDRRLKSDIVRVGRLPNGLSVYDYVIFGQKARGVMADEVEQFMPDAVVRHPSGFKMVNYSMLGVG